MSNFFKSKYKMVALFTACLLVVTLVTGTFAYKSKDGFLSKKDSGESEAVVDGADAGENSLENIPVPLEADINMPSTMRGVFLTPGVDYLKSEKNDVEAIKAEVDKAILAAEELTMNTIIINTSFESQVIYHTIGAEKVMGDFDIMEYIVQKAKEENFYTFGVFDLNSYKAASGTTMLAAGAVTIDPLSENLTEYAEKYKLDAVLLNGYTNPSNNDSYNLYSKVGGAIGFDNFMRQTPESLVQSAKKTISAANPSTQVGIITDPVWANKADDDDGSNTKAKFTSLKDGNTDTKAFVQNGVVDFIAVNAYGSTGDSEVPFSEVVKWWGELAQDASVPLYIVQASSQIGSGAKGWTPEELAKQAAEIEEISGVRGSAFDSLAVLVENPEDSTTKLMNYYKDETVVEKELVLAELEMTKPIETTYKTNEQKVSFTGASDPAQPVMINDTKVRTDASGYFTVSYDLAAGENKFVIVHKEKTIEYSITRQIDILTEIAPTGSVTTDGGMEIGISAYAYQEAVVVATVGGSKVTLQIDDNVVDEGNRDSSYRLFTGHYIAPAATDSVQNLGAISVTATWGGESKTLTGADIAVNKKAKIEDGVPVVVVADQAKTYPANTLDNIPKANTYPLPKGAMDYAVGEEIFYKEVGYTVLASGLRVASADVQASSEHASENKISDISVDVSDGFTYVTLKTAQMISYNFGYENDKVSIVMNNTTSVPENISLSKNPIFTSANWEGSTLTLALVKPGGFMGYKGYYDGEDLVFKFNNPPSSISNARIAIDPGHGGKDVGALGFLADYPEKALNEAIASNLAEELQSRGATVLLLDTSSGMTMDTRVQKAQEFNADIFISVHNNTAPNASAHGSEVYYFYPFSKTLASSASSQVSGQLSTNNRGGKQSYYHVTLSPQFASVLVECGFMSNKDEYEKLIRGKYQERVATGIADSVEATIAAAYTGIDGGGSENAGGSIAVEGNPTSSSSVSSEKPTEASKTKATGVKLNRDTMTISVGKSGTLKATVEPSDAKDKTVTWTSSNTSVATVSTNGTVKGINSGTAQIDAITNDGSFVKSCAVTVSGVGSESTDQVPVDDAELTDSEIDLNVGKTYQLTLNIYPENATDKNITWKTSDSDIATVSDSGLVKGIGSGTTTVTATTDDGGVVSTCYVNVSGDSTSSDSSSEGENSGKTDLSKVVYITAAAPTATMYLNTSQKVIVKDDNDKTISSGSFKWTSSDTSIATVSSSGVITALKKEGTAVITAYSDKYDDLHDSVAISVTKNKVKVTGITLNYGDFEMKKGEKTDLIKATIAPEGAINKEINWSVANASVLSIDQSGVVTARAKGNTTVIARTKEGDFIATCKISVVDEITIYDMWLDVDELELRVEDTDYLTVDFDPAGLTNKNVTWKSSNPSVVSVDGKGNLKALKKGRATITVISNEDNSFVDTCKVIVFE